MEQKPEAQAESTSTTSGEREFIALSTARGGVLGVKAGMTQVFTENGDSVAVTVIELQPNVITQVKTKEKNGYQAVQIGFLDKKAKSATLAEQGHAKKANATGFYHYQEFRFDDKASADSMSAFTVGKSLSAEFVKPGDLVDLTAVSKGKGFQGVMKRYHYAGGFKSHGASVNHRQIGSIGNRADPGRVFPGKKMNGHMGHVQSTVQNVKVVRVDMENGILLVHGSVPGPRSGIVTIQRAIKAVKKAAEKSAKTAAK